MPPDEVQAPANDIAATDIQVQQTDTENATSQPSGEAQPPAPPNGQDVAADKPADPSTVTGEPDEVQPPAAPDSEPTALPAQPAPAAADGAALGANTPASAAIAPVIETLDHLQAVAAEHDIAVMQEPSGTGTAVTLTHTNAAGDTLTTSAVVGANPHPSELTKLFARALAELKKIFLKIEEEIEGKSAK